jgi:hypothetical protein
LKEIEVQPMGRDGRCWRAECIELVLDPFAAREKCYHFVINPEPNSCYDVRLGFITDPRDSLYRGEDKSWNGEWEYFPVIDKEKKKYTVEIKIPFRTLGVESPKSGTMWAANFGRENDGSDVGLWSPNLEDGGMVRRPEGLPLVLPWQGKACRPWQQYGASSLFQSGQGKG